MELVLLVIYGLALAFIFCYSIVQINLVYHYLRYKRQLVTHPETIAVQQVPVAEAPFVTVQLPVFNEKYVAGRLLDAMAELNYDRSKLEVQVLDDSTDETVELIAARVKELRNSGLDIHHIRRKDREGFKAGALAHGLELAKGELIAIFDADFLPHADFLQRTVNHFGDPAIGMVQTRWDHLNRDYSLLTKLQAFGLDAHFSVEQKGRNAAGHFINFNGTAGIWRKTTIRDAGGWQADTLTEDLDLSYRAQLRGWKFCFLDDCGSPAELPAAMNALKTQQFRWTKGAAECSRKNLSKVLVSGRFSWKTKLHAMFHLLNSSVFICVIITSVLSLPVLIVKQYFPEYKTLYRLAGIFLIGVLFLAVFYFTSFATRYDNKWRAFLHFIVQFPLFLAVSMGLSLHNGLAALEGLTGKKSAFIRTPKFNIRGKNDSWKENNYLAKKIDPLSLVELALTVYFIVALFYSLKYRDFGLFPFHLMLAFGFGYVSIFSLLHTFSAGKK